MTMTRCFKAIARAPDAAAGDWPGAGSVPLNAEVNRLEKLTGKAAKPPATGGGGEKKFTADEWLAEELKKQGK